VKLTNDYHTYVETFKNKKQNLENTYNLNMQKRDKKKV
jgi:hypothetical protein